MDDDEVASPILTPPEIAAIDALGKRRAVSGGDYLYREGDAKYDFYVIVSGAVEIVVQADGTERLVARFGPGQFLGELNLLSGQRVYVSARVAESGEVIDVPAATLRELFASRPKLADTILAAFLARRARLLRDGTTAIRLVGSSFSPDSLRLREYLARNRIPHEFMDADRDARVERLLRDLAVQPADLPVVIAPGVVLRHPTPGELASYLGLTLDSIEQRGFDLVVIGGGPAGLAAGVYGSSEGLDTLVLEMTAAGGQAGASSRIENYLGFPTGIAGADLAQKAVVQAEKFGARLTSPCAATGLREEAGYLVVALSDGTEVTGRALIVASGARYRRLEADRLEDFEGNGVYYAATDIEARLCAASPVVVVGGGNSAGQAALFLAEAGSSVSILIRGPDLGKNMSRYLVDRIHADGRISVHTTTTVAGLEGGASLTAVRVRSADGDSVLPCGGLFSFIGADPASGWLSGCAALDEHGFVLTDRSLGGEQLDARWQAMGRLPLPFETSQPGLFAVGDLRSGSIKRVAAAVGEGSAAVRSVHEYLAFAHSDGAHLDG
ncbi:MAG TPA: FAD-dependent oxidoreductase [Candidatus Dormibacteraeota bacterium]|nr:FAD-dependent oxidoreductase [Candidatus Dormibacteraeota bacterium]